MSYINPCNSCAAQLNPWGIWSNLQNTWLDQAPDNYVLQFGSRKIAEKYLLDYKRNELEILASSSSCVNTKKHVPKYLNDLQPQQLRDHCPISEHTGARMQWYKSEDASSNGVDLCWSCWDKLTPVGKEKMTQHFLLDSIFEVQK